MSVAAAEVQMNLEQVHKRVQQAQTRSKRARADIELLVATKYVSLDEMETLAQAGVRRVGENRAQSLLEKHARYQDQFKWDFIGHLQSRKVKQIAPIVDRIHSLSTYSALAALERCGDLQLEGLVEVNLADEPTKSGVSVGELEDFILRARECVQLSGLMTMPPATEDPQKSRRWFRLLRELADRYQLHHCSMGTSQDFEVAVEEGATIIRLGSVIYGAS